MTHIQKILFDLRDEKYRDFQSKLMPTVDKETIIGVRTPELRKLAKKLFEEKTYEKFISTLPHTYYEEYNLHGFIVSLIKDYDECVKRIDELLPYVNNWATCDQIKPKCFSKNKEKVLEKSKEWINSDKTYSIRFAIEMLMNFFLDEDFDKAYPKMISEIRSEEYYVKMMVAWYFATALSKHYDEIIPFIENKELDTWTHNKSIQKAIESYRISDYQKEYLKSLKITK